MNTLERYNTESLENNTEGKVLRYSSIIPQMLLLAQAKGRSLITISLVIVPVGKIHLTVLKKLIIFQTTLGRPLHGMNPPRSGGSLSSAEAQEKGLWGAVIFHDLEIVLRTTGLMGFEVLSHPKAKLMHLPNRNPTAESLTYSSHTLGFGLHCTSSTSPPQPG